jgi:hypothetical protein
MQFKNFFDQTHTLLLSNILYNKFLNKNSYEKSFLRSNLIFSENFQILDNNSSFFNVKKKDNNFSICGCFIKTKFFFYKNKNFCLIRFRAIFHNFMNKDNSLFYLYQSLSDFKSVRSNNFNYLVFLKPIKGGFFCFSSGIIGFLPGKQGIFAIKKVMCYFLKIYRVNTLSFLVKKNLFLNVKHFILRFPFNIGKITVPVKCKRNNFSLSTRNKKKYFYSKLNFVFLIPLKNNIFKNAKINKNNRK